MKPDRGPQIGGPKLENQEKSPVEDLSFDQLQEAVELAKNTFRQTESGFENVAGYRVTIKEKGGKFKVTAIDQDFKRFIHLLIKPEFTSKGFDTEEEIRSEIKKIILETGNRIIE